MFENEFCGGCESEIHLRVNTLQWIICFWNYLYGIEPLIFFVLSLSHFPHLMVPKTSFISNFYWNSFSNGFRFIALIACDNGVPPTNTTCKMIFAEMEMLVYSAMAANGVFERAIIHSEILYSRSTIKTQKRGIES